MINIVCTSKPCDGLMYYSYEYCEHLNGIGIDSQLIIITHREFAPEDYVLAIREKYICYREPIFDDYFPDIDDITLVMGRSMITLPFLSIKYYDDTQLFTLRLLFGSKIISVYSENHVKEYPIALEYFKPTRVVDLCDYDIYPDGIGEHFEKRINFSLYRPFDNSPQFEHLFLGTSPEYYKTALSLVSQYPSNGILTYRGNSYIDTSMNNIYAPIPNILGIFDTYVYAKAVFDPAPRLIQECKFYKKKVIYQRDASIVDGGSIYMNREISDIDATPIIRAISNFY